MISSRTGAALALVLSVVAVALGVAALLTALRGDAEPRAGRLVQTQLAPSESEQPVLFALDDFYLVTGTDGRQRALYVYPPGQFGRQQGCKVSWEPFALASDGEMPGSFSESCGGARFDRDGAWISGPAERGLDEFKMDPGIEGAIVDTSVLYCGAPQPGAAPPTPSGRAERAECERAGANP